MTAALDALTPNQLVAQLRGELGEFIDGHTTKTADYILARLLRGDLHLTKDPKPLMVQKPYKTRMKQIQKNHMHACLVEGRTEFSLGPMQRLVDDFQATDDTARDLEVQLESGVLPLDLVVGLAELGVLNDLGASVYEPGIFWGEFKSFVTEELARDGTN